MRLLFKNFDISISFLCLILFSREVVVSFYKSVIKVVFLKIRISVRDCQIIGPSNILLLARAFFGKRFHYKDIL